MTRGDAEVIEALARKASLVEVVNMDGVDKVGVVVPEGHTLHEFDLEKSADHPRHKRGHVVLTDAASFIAYAARHVEPARSTLWGDVDKATIVAVFDDHGMNSTPGWGKHRATLQLRTTPDWQHWNRCDGSAFSQQAFAEHIEDGAANVRVPDAATMREIARTFHAKTGVDFKSTTRLDSGETQLVFEETVQAKAGQKGTIEIPDMITLALQPFDGSASYEVQAQFRYRLNGGQLTLSYRLVRPDLARRDAFQQLASGIESQLELPVMSGTPRQAGQA